MELKTKSCLVVGDGIIGLTTAILAAKQDWNVKIYTDSNGNEMVSGAVSPTSCALWYPALVGGSKQDLDRWSEISFDYFRRDEGLTGIKKVRNFELIDSEAEWRRPSTSIRGLPRFRSFKHDNVPPGVFGAWQFQTYIISMDFYLPYLRQEAIDLGVNFLSGPRLASLEGVSKQFSTDLVFNCTGIEGSNLSEDEEHTVGVKGHLLFFPPKNTDISIGRKDYAIMPRHDFVTVGALFIENFDKIDPRDEDRKNILNEVNSWIDAGVLDLDLDYDFSEGNILFERTGLRPYRKSGVRIGIWTTQAEDVVVDNYGHGGSGVTICWGCAEDAVNLANGI